MSWVISVYFNLRNILAKSGTFLQGHSVYIYIYIYIYISIYIHIYIYMYKLCFFLSLIWLNTANFGLFDLEDAGTVGL